MKRELVSPRLSLMILLSVFWLAASAVASASPRIVHVFVALADNQHQGIVPIPAALAIGLKRRK